MHCMAMVRDQKRSLRVPKGMAKSRKRAYGSVELSRLIREEGKEWGQPRSRSLSCCNLVLHLLLVHLTDS